MVQQNYFQFYIQQTFRSFCKIFPCNYRYRSESNFVWTIKI